MDNVCHTLVGAALGRAGLSRQTRFGGAALMVSANVPDVDVLVFFTDVTSVSFRRGWTHGIVAQVLLPIGVAAAFWAADRLRPKDAAGEPPLDVWWLLGLSYIGLYSHLLLDYVNTYGVRLLAPFDWRWIYGDAVFIIDLWLWLGLGAGVWLSRRRQSRRPARVALSAAAGYVAAMVIAAGASRAIVVDAWVQAHGAAPRALMVGPRPLTPLVRDVIVDAGDRYEGGLFDWRSRRVAWEPEPMLKNDRLPEVIAARTAPEIQAFLVWSRFPYWQVERGADGAKVTVRDMRFMAGGRQFAASTVVRSTASPR